MEPTIIASVAAELGLLFRPRRDGSIDLIDPDFGADRYRCAVRLRKGRAIPWVLYWVEADFPLRPRKLARGTDLRAVIRAALLDARMAVERLKILRGIGGERDLALRVIETFARARPLRARRAREGLEAILRLGDGHSAWTAVLALARVSRLAPHAGRLLERFDDLLRGAVPSRLFGRVR